MKFVMVSKVIYDVKGDEMVKVKTIEDFMDALATGEIEMSIPEISITTEDGDELIDDAQDFQKFMNEYIAGVKVEL
jgi:hypothetical protein